MKALLALRTDFLDSELSVFFNILCAFFIFSVATLITFGIVLDLANGFDPIILYLFVIVAHLVRIEFVRERSTKSHRCFRGGFGSCWGGYAPGIIQIGICHVYFHISYKPAST